MLDAFCRCYATPGTDTYGNGAKSAIAAGYSKKNAASQASRMLRKPCILRRIIELQIENIGFSRRTIHIIPYRRRRYGRT